MKKCIIIGGGDFSDKFSVSEEDFVIACDIGLKHLSSKKIAPDLIIGDFDSLGYVPEGAVVLPSEKDITDIRAAIDYALKNGFTDFEIYGGLGGSRLSHSIANIHHLIFLTQKGCTCVLHGDKTAVIAVDSEFSAKKTVDLKLFAKKSCNCDLHDSKTAATAIGKGEKYYENIALEHKYISVFSYADSAVVSISGLKYELNEFKLSNFVPLGVSNEFTDDGSESKPAQITVHSGTAVIVFEFE